MSTGKKIQIRNSTKEHLEDIVATGKSKTNAVCRDFRHTAKGGGA